MYNFLLLITVCNLNYISHKLEKNQLVFEEYPNEITQISKERTYLSFFLKIITLTTIIFSVKI